MRTIPAFLSLRCALPKAFTNIHDVRKAISMAVAELEDRYGVRTHGQIQELCVQDELTDFQITFADCLRAA